MEAMTKERFNEIIDEIYFNKQSQGTEPANKIWEYIETLTQPNNTGEARTFLESKGIDCNDIVAYSTPNGTDPPIDMDIEELLTEFKKQ